MLIDTTARKQLAEQLRHLVSTVITNFQYEDKQWDSGLYRSKDDGVRAVYWAAWTLYDDLHEHRMTKEHRLSEEGRHIISRWILFLRSDLPYEWPVFQLARPFTLWCELRALFQIGTTDLPALARFDRRGDFDVWPFYRRADYERALSSPVLLAGGA